MAAGDWSGPQYRAVTYAQEKTCRLWKSLLGKERQQYELNGDTKHGSKGVNGRGN